MEKVQNLKMQQVTETAKRQRLAEDVMIVTGQNYQEVRLENPMQYLHSTKVYLNTLALGGQRKVKSNIQLDGHGAGAEVVFTPLQDTLNYQSFMEEKARAYMQRHLGASPRQVLVWLRAADGATRSAGLELVRRLHFLDG